MSEIRVSTGGARAVMRDPSSTAAEYNLAADLIAARAETIARDAEIATLRAALASEQSTRAAVEQALRDQTRRAEEIAGERDALADRVAAMGADFSRIANATNADETGATNYRADDREGCLDFVYAVASKAAGDKGESVAAVLKAARRFEKLRTVAEERALIEAVRALELLAARGSGR